MRNIKIGEKFDWDKASGDIDSLTRSGHTGTRGFQFKTRDSYSYPYIGDRASYRDVDWTWLFDKRCEEVGAYPSETKGRPGRKYQDIRRVVEYWNLPPFPFCLHCGWSPDEDTWEEAHGWIELSHIINRSMSGLDGIQNIAPLCGFCNRTQQAFDAGDDWSASNYFVLDWPSGWMPMVAIIAWSVRYKDNSLKASKLRVKKARAGFRPPMDTVAKFEELGLRVSDQLKGFFEGDYSPDDYGPDAMLIEKKSEGNR